jgi:hypothetical protein
METFLELLILKKEGRLHFPLSPIVKSLYQVEVVQRTLIWDIAPEISNFAIFGFYLENCER